MIQELTSFTAQLNPVFKNIGLNPKEGLSLVLKPDRTSDGTFVISENLEWAVFSKKTKERNGLHQKFASWTDAAWMIDTFKCFDAPYKAIHSCSPFCLAFKRVALEGGEAYRKIERAIEAGKNKKQLYDRISSYFEKTFALLEEGEEEEKELAKVFFEALDSQEKIHSWLSRTDAYEAMKDKDYIAFYLDLPVDSYKKAHKRYLRDKLFNTAAYNREDDRGEVWGTSNFFNGFGVKKPFLMHKSATFDISGRISSLEARRLYEFDQLLRRNIFPRPLPIFILKEELIAESINIFKREALLEREWRKSHAEIIGELYKDHRDDFGNYYLLYYTGGKIKDFDYVSKFRYEFQNEKGLPQAWQVHKLMRDGEAFTLENVFEFQNRLLPAILNNSLVVKSKKGGLITKYFEDIDQKYCDNNNAVIYGLVLKYRKALYDFIYKSKQASLTAAAFRDIMLSGIASDIRRDEERKNGWRICQKLNIWFSLNRHFDPSNSNFNRLDMTTTIPQLMAKMRLVANENAHFETPEEFAFGAGQVIYFLLDKSRTGNKTHALLEPFTQKVKLEMLKLEIARIFDRYKHEISFGKGRFERLMREVLGYSGAVNLKSQIPVLLAGYFADPVIYEKKENDV